MKKFRVVANPKGGTCSQLVEANTPEEAIAKAQGLKDGWEHARPKTEKDWTYRAYER